MKEKFKGVFPALLTPFDKNGAINVDSVKKLVDLNVKKGVNGFYVGGSSGEGLLLTVDERKQLFKAAAEANEGRTTLIAHSPAVMEYLLGALVQKRFGGRIWSGEIGLPVRSSGLTLPCGSTAVWEE